MITSLISFFPSLIRIADNAATGDVGRIGEDVAAAYLIKHGYRIKERNYRACGHEIDIIATKGSEIHFIEVKTRSLTSDGYTQRAAEAVSQNQMRNILKCATYYLHGKQSFNGIFFDIIGVNLRKKKNILKITETEHIIGAFTA